MKFSKEQLRELLANKELIEKLEEAWKNGVIESTIEAIQSEFGIKIDVETAEQLLALAQKKKLADISSFKIDEDRLADVVGAGNGVCDGQGNCDEFFNKIPSLPKHLRCPGCDYLCDSWDTIGCNGNWIDFRKCLSGEWGQVGPS